MMFTTFNTDCDSSSRCSTASPSNADNIGYYPSPGSQSSIGSPQSQDFTDLSSVSSASFIPTVTAISSSPDLRWMVQPVVPSVAPSNPRAHPYGANPTSAYSRPGMLKTPTKSGRRGRMEQLSPEEEEKRRVRRERNKQAAAKCRNRRRELTDTLQAETDDLEDEKSALQTDIANLMKEKERLEFILAAHKPICKIPADLPEAFPITTTSSMVLESVATRPQSTFAGSPSSPEHPLSISTAAVTTTSSSSASLFSSPSSVVALGGDMTAVKMAAVDLDSALEDSLDMLAKSELETARSVPDMELPGALYTQDWEPLYTSAGNELEPLCTPVVTCTPSCTTYTSSFSFTYPESEVFPTCGLAHRRGSSSNDQSSDSLSSPTLLAL